MSEGKENPTRTEVTNHAYYIERESQASELEEAERRYKRALKLFSDFPNTDNVAEAICRDNLGVLYAATGRLGEAIRLHQEALKELRKHPERLDDIAICRANLGTAYLSLDNLEPAGEHLRAAVERLGERPMPTRAYVTALVSLAQVHAPREESESLLREAEQLCESIGAESTDVAIMADGMLGALLLQRGKIRGEARTRLERASSQADILPPGHPHRILISTSLGELYLKAGELAAGQEVLEHAYARYRAYAQYGTAGSSRSVERLREILSRIYEGQGRLAEAVNLLAQNVESEAKRVANLFRIGSERDRMEYATGARQRIDEFLGIALRRQKMIPSIRRQALEFWLERKGLTTEAVAAIIKLEVRRLPADVANRLAEIRRLNAELDHEERLLTFDHRHSIRLWNARKEVLYNRRRELAEQERMLVPLFPGFDYEGLIEKVDIDRIARCLPPNAALIEFAKHGSSDADEHYAAFVVRGDDPGHVHLVDMGRAIEVDQLVASFRHALAPENPDLTDEIGEPGNPDDLARHILTGKLWPIIVGLQRLIISPDGALWWLPFHALPLDGDKGQKEYWIDRFEISYLASGRDLLMDSNPRDDRKRVGRPIVLADPDYDYEGLGGRNETQSPPTKHFDRLSGTREEGRSVARKLRTRARLDRHADKSVVLNAHGPRILHIASHAFFDVRYNVHTAELNRMDNGGLAFAGANRHIERGCLLAPEIVTVDLEGTELVVLSACVTGLGDVVAGEGVWGLQLAFRLAGADAIVMSLWRVKNGPATMRMMELFYDSLLRGESKSSALRNAQLGVRKCYPRRNLWAPFMCFGNIRPIENVAG
jgi:tetratricopeptide (TPR) repeat protein